MLTSFPGQDDPKVHTVVEKLLDVLNTPSEAVQRAVSSCLSPLMQSKQVCFRISPVGLSQFLSEMTNFMLLSIGPKLYASSPFTICYCF